MTEANRIRVQRDTLLVALAEAINHINDQGDDKDSVEVEFIDRLSGILANQGTPEPRFMYVWGGGEADRASDFAPLSEMLHSNREFPEFCDWLRKAAVGQSFMTGGGAAPVVTTWRIA